MSTEEEPVHRRLVPPVDPARDHYLGGDAPTIALTEFGSYGCPHCRAANEHIVAVRDQMGDRLRYVFRHRPITGSEIARRAAELAERARTPERFWEAHETLMTRSARLTEDDLIFVAHQLGLDRLDPETDAAEAEEARARVAADIESARDSGVRLTPTFFINRRRYDGPWDRSSVLDAMAGTLGHRVRSVAQDFAGWGPSAGLLLLAATIVALIISNTSLGEDFLAFWERYAGVSFGDAEFHMSLLHWVNDALLTTFFLVVGLEIKREFTVGHLVQRRTAALPIAAALGGMIVPVALYMILIPAGDWSHGWGMAMATDTAFAIAIIVLMGKRVPFELRVFLTAAAIIDDIGAVIVVTLFYSEELNMVWFAAAVVVTLALAFLHRASVYRLTPYVILGVVLWVCVYSAGVHATLAGIILAFFIPTRPPPNFSVLMSQANVLIAAEAAHGAEALRQGPSGPTLRALEDIHERLESPADRLLRRAGARSSYVVLPIFALANAGVIISGDVLDGNGALMLAIIVGLTIGKPLGFIAFSALAVWMKIAVKPAGYSWRQLAGAGALAGIGFTMSLFIAGQALADPTDFAAAKIAIFSASIASALIGIALLWNAERARTGHVEEVSTEDHTALAPEPVASQTTIQTPG